MNLQRLKIASAALAPAVATMLFVQACGGSGDATAQSTSDPIEGVWEAVATLRDCNSQAALASFRGSQVLHRGGTLGDTNGAAPGTRGPGFGLWSRNADGTYAIRFRFFRYNSDGSLAGSNVVSSTRTLSGDGSRYEAVTRAEVRDLAGTVLQTTCVTDVGTRFN